MNLREHQAPGDIGFVNYDLRNPDAQIERYRKLMDMQAYNLHANTGQVPLQEKRVHYQPPPPQPYYPGGGGAQYP